MNLTLAARLAPVVDLLGELERDYRARAQADNEPDVWAAWSDLHAALMALRAAQGRDARARRYAPPEPAARTGHASCGSSPSERTARE